LHTIAFLRAHGLAELEHRFAVRGVRHRAYPNLVLLKYSQIDSPMAEPVVQECRGLISRPRSTGPRRGCTRSWTDR
jgi:hypothetical protein